MKTLLQTITSIVLVATLSITSANAGSTVPSWSSLSKYMTSTTPHGCSQHSKDARIIMNLRQSGLSKSEASKLILSNKQRSLLDDAYNQPLVSDNRKGMTSSLFGKKYLDLCKSGK